METERAERISQVVSQVGHEFSLGAEAGTGARSAWCRCRAADAQRRQPFSWNRGGEIAQANCPTTDARVRRRSRRIVLEHIDDDRKGIRELFRVTRPGGFAMISVPQNMARERTYENPAITDLDERFVHFGATDHKRYYARDFGDRLAEPGYEVSPYRRDEPEEVRYGLNRGEQIYICRKPGKPSYGHQVLDFVH